MKSHGVTVSSDFGNRGTGTGTTPGGGAPGGGMGTGTSTTGTPPSGTGTMTGKMPTGTRPSGTGGFFGGTRSAKEEAAFKACSKYMKGGFGGGQMAGAGGGRAHFSAATLKSFVACVRKNGYAAMPEASTSTTGSLFPKSIENNAKFKTASAKCESVLRAGMPSGGGAPGNTTSTTSTS